jgi:Na+-transporting NADH:ubiquinone oxidoreductase subunit NqrB
MIVFQDRRDYQIIFLSCFLFLGLLTRDWSIQPILIGTIILTCLATQWGLSTIREVEKGRDDNDLVINRTQSLITSTFDSKVLNSLRSSLITALGLCLLLRGNSYQTAILASFLAIASKFLFRYRSKHFFNPANFGIISALLLTNDAWVSPGQWGTDWWYLLLFAGMGGIILQKVGRWDTSVTFLLVYAGLEAIRDAWLGWSGDVWLHQLSSGSLLLFALFMLTDPRSIPNATVGRIFWATAIALVTVILQDYFYINTAIFWALFIISPLTILFDLVWSAPRFMWKKLQVVSS